MSKSISRLFLAGAVLSLGALLIHAQSNSAKPVNSSMTKDQKIQNALSAAPAGISKNAAVVEMGAGGAMTELKKGTNGWTCIPDNPANPVNDPMCMDKVAMQWADAWMHKKPVTITSLGIGYMLQGGSTADNDDPFAEKPKPGKDWLKEPPHIMIFGTKLAAGMYATTPDTTQPWVMWKGTPYEHLMVPAK
jgi:hypothetical protein